MFIISHALVPGGVEEFGVFVAGEVALFLRPCVNVPARNCGGKVHDYVVWLDPLQKPVGCFDVLMGFEGVADHDVCRGFDLELVAPLEGHLRLCGCGALLIAVEDLLASAFHPEAYAVAAAFAHDPDLVAGDRVDPAVAVPLQLDPGLPQKVAVLLEPFGGVHRYRVVLEKDPELFGVSKRRELDDLPHDVFSGTEADAAPEDKVGTGLAVRAVKGAAPGGDHSVLAEAVGQVPVVVNHIPGGVGDFVKVAG